MEEKYLGLNFQNINREDIPYTGKLEKFDMLENSFGDRIMLIERDQFVYLNNDVSKFIGINQRFSNWVKL